MWRPLNTIMSSPGDSTAYILCKCGPLVLFQAYVLFPNDLFI